MQRKYLRIIKIENKELKLSLFMDILMLYLENPKEYKNKVLQLAHESSKVTENKVNSQKSIIYVHTHSRLTGK